MRKVLKKEQLLKFVYELVFLEIEDDIRKNVIPKFIENFNEEYNMLDGFRKFQESIKHLYNSVIQILPTLEKLGKLKQESDIDFKIYGTENIIESYKITLIGTILFDLPERYTNIVESFYTVSFKIFCNCNYASLSKLIIFKKFLF